MNWVLIKCSKCGDRVQYNKSAIQAKQNSCPLSDCSLKHTNMAMVPDVEIKEEKTKVPDGFYEAYAQPMLTTHIFDKKTKSRITFKEKKV